MRLEGQRPNQLQLDQQRQAPAVTEATKTAATGSVDRFDGRNRELSTTARGAGENKGFFTRLFEGISNFFKSIFSLFGGKSSATTSSDSGNDDASQLANQPVGRTRQRTAPEDVLRPNVTTASTNGVSTSSGNRGTTTGNVSSNPRVSTSGNWPPNLSRFSNSGVNSRLPTNDPNIHHYKPLAYGTERTIELLTAVAGRYNELTGMVLRVGDISKRGGGDVPGHGSHETGKNIDLDLAFNDGRTTAESRRESTNASWRSPAYDRDATRTMIRLIKECNPNAQILFNDPVLVAEGLVRAFPNHDNHMHVQHLG